MTNELDAFDGLLKDYGSEKMDPRFISDLEWSRQLFNIEVIAVKKTILQRVYFYELHKKKAIAYIQNVEKSLLKFASKLVAFSTFFQLFRGAIDDLLEFLISHFDRYFDYQLVATISYKEKVILSEKERVTKINAFLIGKTLNPSLTLLIQDYIGLTNHVVETYNDLHYYKMFCAEVMKWSSNHLIADPNSIFIRGLIRINFNSNEFIEFLNTLLTGNYNDLPSLEIAAAHCAQHLRNIKHIANQNIWAYDWNQLSAKLLVINNIEAEIVYITNLVHFNRDGNPQVVEDLNTKGFVVVNLNLEQLTYFFKLLVIHKVFVVNHKGDFFKFISDNFRTKNKLGKLTEGSIRNKWGTVTTRTKANVRVLCLDLINRINENDKK